MPDQVSPATTSLSCMHGLSRCAPFIKIMGARTGACVQSRTGHMEGIQDMALNHEGTLVLTGSDDNSARIFDVRT